jgi:pimeloyl-[acyl-carrier protein] methyl ester esterase
LTRLPVAGGEIEVERIGTGLPLLFVHGWTLDRRVWTPQALALASRFEVIAHDRRGFGRSNAGPSLTEEVADLGAILDQLGYDRGVIIAMSQAARVALAFTLRAPDRVAALILQGAPPIDAGSGSENDPDEPPIATMRTLARSGQMDALRQLWSKHPLIDLPGAQARTLLDAMIADYEARDLFADGFGLNFQMAMFAALQCPTLLITGAEDSTARRHGARLIATACERVRHQEIPGAGHLCNLSSPRSYNALLIKFLRRITG